ncbi:MAG TPA: peroxiredoxin family protein [Planctomycetota bacterium]|nr:peroxiredoxin family protein [Planctomycetota bacterium]
MSCRAELRGLGAVDEALRAKGGRLLAISVDSPEALADLAGEMGLGFPLLSDRERRVVREYGLLHPGGSPEKGDIAIPANFLVDRRGAIRWRHIARRIQDRVDPASLVAEIGRLP